VEQLPRAIPRVPTRDDPRLQLDQLEVMERPQAPGPETLWCRRSAVVHTARDSFTSFAHPVKCINVLAG